jgi:ribulose-5-phosphate 4-epimerase/fuculose-1-phosphate aldolase
VLAHSMRSMTPPDDTTATLDDLVTASRVLAAQGVLDGFGHVSARHPEREDRFVIPRMRAPGLVTRADLLEVDLTGRVCSAQAAPAPAERAIHAAIYRERPDVHAVCHHHAAALLAFAITGTQLLPVCHVGAAMGSHVPLWDSRDEFGDTDLLVTSAAQGQSLARALGPWWTVLMRGHGATVAARSVRELAFRSIYGAHDAALQLSASRLGPVRALSAGEAAAAGELNLRSAIVNRSWDLWSARLATPHIPCSTSGETT